MASTKNVRTAVFFGLVMALFAPAMRALFAQRPSPAEGPWSGQAQCVVVAKWADYLDEQTHTWRLTGAPPTPAPRGSAQVYYTWPAAWIVTGGGRKTFASRTPGATARDEQSERWTIANEMNATLRITEIAGTPVRVRIAAEGQRGAPLGSIRVTEVSGRTREASVQPWQFPTIEDNATSTTISGTSTRTLPEGFGVGWGQPRNAMTTATCTWSFTRGGVEQSSANTPTGGRGVGAHGAMSATPTTGSTPVTVQTAVTGVNPSLVTTPASQTPASGPHPITTTPGAGAGASSSRQRATAGSSSAPTPDGLSNVPSGTTPSGIAITGTAMKPCTTIPAPQFSATPGEVTFNLNGPVGTTGYRISRRDLGELTPTPVTTSSYTHAAPLDYQTTYQYVITGIQTDNGCTTASVSVTPPGPLTPQVTASVTPGALSSRVTLSWGTQTDRPTSYLITGVGIPEAGAEVPFSINASSYSFNIDSLQPGSHSWHVLPLWKTPTGNMSDADRGGRVTATVTRTTGTYLVTVTGLICGEPTVDTAVGGLVSFGHPDGAGDEIQAAVYLRRFDRRTQQLMEYGNRITRPHGDITGGPGRLQAGSMTSTGGIQAGDWIPAGFSIARASVAQESAFPWKVWEGQLTDGVDVVLVSPTVWEHDGNPANYGKWVDGQRILDQTIFTGSSVQGRITNQVLAPVEAGSVPRVFIGSDRDIGPSGLVIPNTTIVLTREIIEKALSSWWPPTQWVATGMQVGVPKPGIMVVTFTDSPGDFNPSPATYSMIIQVERLPD